MRRHGGARRILSLELLGFKNLLSPASLYSRVNRWLMVTLERARPWGNRFNPSWAPMFMSFQKDFIGLFHIFVPGKICSLGVLTCEFFEIKIECRKIKPLLKGTPIIRCANPSKLVQHSFSLLGYFLCWDLVTAEQAIFSYLCLAVTSQH